MYLRVLWQHTGCMDYTPSTPVCAGDIPHLGKNSHTLRVTVFLNVWVSVTMEVGGLRGFTLVPYFSCEPTAATAASK